MLPDIKNCVIMHSAFSPNKENELGFFAKNLRVHRKRDF